MKSKVQTYELTDSPDYEGVLVLLKFVEQHDKDEKLDLDTLMNITKIHTDAKLKRLSTNGGQTR